MLLSNWEKVVAMVEIPSIWHHKVIGVNDSYCQIKCLIRLWRLLSVWLPLLSLSLCVQVFLSPQFCVLGYRVTGAVLVCGVPQSPKGPQLPVMVSISLVPDWKKWCVCVFCTIHSEETGVHTGQGCCYILTTKIQLFYCNSEMKDVLNKCSEPTAWFKHPYSLRPWSFTST